MRAAEPPRKSLAWALLFLAGTLQAAQFTMNGPAGSGEFGRTVTILPNGNIVVTDPGFDAPGPVTDVGAVYLHRPNGTLISTLRGSSANDRVGSSGVVVLANGNFVVPSPGWDDGGVADVGAVTFVSGTSGIGGVVSASNSLVGGTAGDGVGGAGVTALGNGNYVVRSPAWDRGAVADAGAATFGSGTSGISGLVALSNSLVGSTLDDRVGISGVTALDNGNYVVCSANWDHGAIADAGAATFGAGTGGLSGAVSVSNSLVGGTANDRVGSSCATALRGGNYVVSSPNWRNGATGGAGAVTFGSGITGIVGAVSSANSLVGTRSLDFVGLFGVIPLTNGNYVVNSPFWDLGDVANAGAVTFGSGTSGISGEVSAANSLVGGTAFDQAGDGGVTVLGSGNYVVRSPAWDHGAIANAGAATFGSGTSGISGAISPSNSLVGSTAGDRVGSGSATALANGHYVVRSPNWDHGAIADAGAATFGSGTNGIVGVITASNSLVGGTAGDQVGSAGATALPDGNYVVASPLWDHGAIADAGAATLGSGAGGIVGAITASNSLLGGTANDQVGSGGVTALGNSQYVVRSPNWDHGAIADAGAVTFGARTSGISGSVSAANSLVGSTAGDQVGSGGVTAAGIDDYAVNSPSWDHAAAADAGAVTLGLRDGSVLGAVTTAHSVLGGVAGAGASQTFSYDGRRRQLAVGQPASNRVVLQRPGIATTMTIVGDTPDPSVGGQAVTFTATLSASPSLPTQGSGLVFFTASSGEICVDSTPTVTSPTTANYSCTLTFTANGTSTVVAELIGSTTLAYGGSDPETHTTIVDPVFGSGFEAP